MSESTPQILNWQGPNGRLLMTLIEGLPKDRAFVLNIFGSTPLQLQLDASFLSGEVDLFSDQDVAAVVEAMKIAKGQSEPYIEVVSESVFIAAPSWRDRAVKEVYDNVTVYVASPIDVLVGKLKRLEEKDIKASDLVRAKTGGPSEEELRKALSRVVHMFAPAFDRRSTLQEIANGYGR